MRKTNGHYEYVTMIQTARDNNKPELLQLQSRLLTKSIAVILLDF